MFAVSASRRARDDHRSHDRPGSFAIAFLMLDIGQRRAPPTIAHTLRVLDDIGEAHGFSRPASGLGRTADRGRPDLRGRWIAGNSVNNGPDAAHRRAVLVVTGRAYVAQRFAIDWVQIQNELAASTRPERARRQERQLFLLQSTDLQRCRPAKWSACLGRLAGKCAPFADLRHTRSTSTTPPAIIVVVEIAPAPLRSLRAHAPRHRGGQGRRRRPRRRRSLATSAIPEARTEPHLHMHIDDRAVRSSAGNGHALRIRSRAEKAAPVEANVSSPTAISLRADRTLSTRSSTIIRPPMHS